jgi:hypothetical protein
MAMAFGSCGKQRAKEAANQIAELDVPLGLFDGD